MIKLNLHSSLLSPLSALPPAPNGRLELAIADAPDDVSPHTSDAGLYTMDPSAAVPQESNSSAIRHPTIIILRVSGRKQKYIWLVSIAVNMEVHMIQYGSQWASMIRRGD